MSKMKRINVQRKTDIMEIAQQKNKNRQRYWIDFFLNSYIFIKTITGVCDDWIILFMACNDSLLVQKGIMPEGQTVQECTDGVDNDEDGFIDCDDQDCSIYDECSSETVREEGTVEGDCADGIDNDNDGFIDCEDMGCLDADVSNDTGIGEPSTEPTSEPSETDPNLTDDDGDGYSENDGDCDDTNASIYPNANDRPSMELIKIVTIQMGLMQMVMAMLMKMAEAMIVMIKTDIYPNAVELR